eukprot:8506358-Pyramimonas_sp.AAC.1
MQLSSILSSKMYQRQIHADEEAALIVKRAAAAAAPKSYMPPPPHQPPELREVAPIAPPPA